MHNYNNNATFDKINLEFFAKGKAVKLDKSEILNKPFGSLKAKLEDAKAHDYDFIPVKLFDWTLVDVTKSLALKEIVYSNKVMVLFNNCKFNYLLKNLINSEVDLILILDGHQNLKAVLNKYDIQKDSILARVYLSFVELENILIFYILRSSRESDFQVFYKDKYFTRYSSMSPEIINNNNIPGLVDEKELVWHAHTKVLVDFFYQSLPVLDQNFASNQVTVTNTLDLIHKTRNSIAHPRYTGSNSIHINLELLHTLQVIDSMKDDILTINSKIQGFDEWYTKFSG